jgi:hypothetical protein
VLGVVVVWPLLVSFFSDAALFVFSPELFVEDDLVVVVGLTPAFVVVFVVVLVGVVFVGVVLVGVVRVAAVVCVCVVVVLVAVVVVPVAGVVVPVAGVVAVDVVVVSVPSSSGVRAEATEAVASVVS